MTDNTKVLIGILAVAAVGGTIAIVALNKKPKTTSALQQQAQAILNKPKTTVPVQTTVPTTKRDGSKLATFVTNLANVTTTAATTYNNLKSGTVNPAAPKPVVPTTTPNPSLLQY